MQNTVANCNTGTLLAWMSGLSEYLLLVKLIKMVRYSEYWLSDQGLVPTGEGAGNFLTTTTQPSPFQWFMAILQPSGKTADQSHPYVAQIESNEGGKVS
jgi:hypothetical protein